jgi:hypothetical protein
MKECEVDHTQHNQNAHHGESLPDLETAYAIPTKQDHSDKDKYTRGYYQPPG